jgi:hypothetical protein
MVWLIGDFHAVRLRPVQISGGILHLRVGLRRTMSIPLASIAEVRAPVKDGQNERRDHLKAVLVGAPNRRIELTNPTRAIGFYGMTRRVTTIDLHIDEPARFDAAVDETVDVRPSWKPHPRSG